MFGGESESEGLLEVCFSQRWGTVNGDGWTSSDTQVACRQLGFEGVDKLKDKRYNVLPKLLYDIDFCTCRSSAHIQVSI